MSQFMSQITYWACNFAPRSFAFCSGQTLAISQFSALFSLLGTAFGGDGRTTFRLPDLRGRAPVGSADMGTGPGLGTYPRGMMYGFEWITLTTLQMPQHNHPVSLTGLSATVNVQVSDQQANTHAPTAGQSIAAMYDNNSLASLDGFNSNTPNVTLNGGSGSITGTLTVNANGSSDSHYNLMPLDVVNACIAMQGIYPSRN